ncbi:MAG: hypothetical protein F4087_12230 [Gemmatimonadetes bacterium]|nr:hypothetical protein [Gemmatimonadota bacterium]MYJ69260.1 hypothetical protein [Gemmatimonadota bacterium]
MANIDALRANMAVKYRRWKGCPTMSEHNELTDAVIEYLTALRAECLRDGLAGHEVAERLLGIDGAEASG